uniref:Uncharacterized protein n=1 Tax=Siphoviridae sp. ctEw721 TaxID=2825400 RepID=A0A8S5TRZ0_9CAUD|nr:MAG TPA: hypothetical protein [Siphoviridae sp. ctEw721]
MCYAIRSRVLFYLSYNKRKILLNKSNKKKEKRIKKRNNNIKI